jgi:hypothetical protein
MTQIEAHDRVYGVGKATRKTRKERASVLASRPHIRAEIEGFEEQLSPLPDLRALKTEMLQNMRWLAKHSPSQTVRLAASVRLVDECNAREDRERKLLDSGPVSLEQLLSELGSLRENQQPTLELTAITADALAEAESQVVVGDADDTAGDR